MNDDENNRIKKYDFNEEEYKNKKSPSSNVSIWPIIIFIVVIAALIIGGVKAITYFTSNNNPKTELKSNKKYIKNSKSKDNNSNKTYNKNSSEKRNHKTNDSNESNTNNNTNNANSTNSSNQNSNNDIFSQPHTFSSVADAQNYAKATQNNWLSDGYKTYTISSDSQGYYILKFVK